MNYWLMKSEPGVFGVEDLALAPGKTAPWWGVRNYQARNFMRDQMIPGIAGIAKISKLAYPDETQFDRNSEYFDPKASRGKPRWFNVDVTLVRKTRVIGLPELRSHTELASMRVLQRGNRLSITPVDSSEADFIMKLL